MAIKTLNSNGFLADLDQRSREIFKSIVDTYLQTGEPVGSRNISKILSMSLSPASIRNVMSDLESLGLIYAPHISAGRIPTDQGLRFFIDSMLEIGQLSEREQVEIEDKINSQSRDNNVEDLLSQASSLLSGLTKTAGIVLTPKRDVRIKQIEYVRLEPTKALVVLVGQDGSIENRIIDIDATLPTSALIEASNALNASIAGLTLSQACQSVGDSIDKLNSELDILTSKLIQEGLADWSGPSDSEMKTLIVRGRSHLLGENFATDELERIRLLFDDLEHKKELIELLSYAEEGDGVRIFIGSENNLFSLSGSSVVVSPYRDSENNVIGVLGVIGPTRVNYSRIIPMVDYTSGLISTLLK